MLNSPILLMKDIIISLRKKNKIIYYFVYWKEMNDQFFILKNYRQGISKIYIERNE